MKKNIIIAVTVIASLCLLYWGIEYLKGVNLFKPVNFYYTKFERVNGLNVSAPITINGFQVGLVREINYDYTSNEISVLMSLDKDLKIPTGSTVSIDTELMGTSTLAIHLGESSTFMTVGDHIPGVVTGGLMDKIGSNVMPQLSVMLPKIDSILTSVNTLLSNPALNASITRLDNITAQLESSSEQLNKMITDINKQMPGITSNISNITGEFSDAAQNINGLSASLNKLPLESTVAELNSTITNLHNVTDKLNSKNSSLGLLLNDKGLYENANNSVASLDSLLRDIKANPKRYVTIKVF